MGTSLVRIGSTYQRRSLAACKLMLLALVLAAGPAYGIRIAASTFASYGTLVDGDNFFELDLSHWTAGSQTASVSSNVSVPGSGIPADSYAQLHTGIGSTEEGSFQLRTLTYDTGDGPSFAHAMIDFHASYAVMLPRPVNVVIGTPVHGFLGLVSNGSSVDIGETEFGINTTVLVSHPGGPPAVGRFAGEIDYVNSFGNLMVSDRGDLNGAYSSFGLSTIEVSSLGIVKFPGLPFVTLAPGGVVEIDLRLTASSGARKDSEGSLAPSARAVFDRTARLDLKAYDPDTGLELTDAQFVLVPSAIPEPATYAMLLAGLGTVLGITLGLKRRPS